MIVKARTIVWAFFIESGRSKRPGSLLLSGILRLINLTAFLIAQKPMR